MLLCLIILDKMARATISEFYQIIKLTRLNSLNFSIYDFGILPNYSSHLLGLILQTMGIKINFQ